MFNNKTILVTGSAGFIGYYLSKRLLEDLNNTRYIKTNKYSVSKFELNIF